MKNFLRNASIALIGIVFILIAFSLTQGCSNKIVPSNSHAMNPIIPLNGYIVQNIEFNGIMFGKTVAELRSMIKEQFPDCDAIYVDSNDSNIFYVFTKTGE